LKLAFLLVNHLQLNVNIDEDFYKY